MLGDLTAKELATIRQIQSKELIGHDRRDMLLAKGFAALLKSNGNTTDWMELVRGLFPLEIPASTKTEDDLMSLLDSMCQ